MAKDDSEFSKALRNNIFVLPFRALAAPITAAKEYYTKPYKGQKYEGTFAQKLRLKKIAGLIYNGELLSNSDRLFMDMFNRFVTGEGHTPVDQSEVIMKCSDSPKCEPYIYKGGKYSGSYKEKENVESEEEKDKPIDNSKSRYKFYFNNELKPKNSNSYFKIKGVYNMTFLGKVQKNNKIEYNFKNNFLEKNDYLIFSSRHANTIGRYVEYEVYQDNFKTPLKNREYLGKVSIKIV